MSSTKTSLPNVFDLACRLEPIGSHVALFAIKWLASNRGPQKVSNLFAAFNVEYKNDPEFEDIIGEKIQGLVDIGYLDDGIELPDGEAMIFLNRPAFARLIAELSALGQGVVT